MGLAGMETSVPAGTVTPLENVNGRIARRVMGTEKKLGENQRLILGILEKEYGEREAEPSTRWVSRSKLSILYILSVPAFVQPSSLITASTSCRRGSKYSGLERRRYNICVNVYRNEIIRIVEHVETGYYYSPNTSYVYSQN